jgi:hypothetical protein
MISHKTNLIVFTPSTPVIPITLGYLSGVAINTTDGLPLPDGWYYLYAPFNGQSLQTPSLVHLNPLTVGYYEGYTTHVPRSCAGQTEFIVGRCGQICLTVGWDRSSGQQPDALATSTDKTWLFLKGRAKGYKPADGLPLSQNEQLARIGIITRYNREFPTLFADGGCECEPRKCGSCELTYAEAISGRWWGGVATFISLMRTQQVSDCVFGKFVTLQHQETRPFDPRDTRTQDTSSWIIPDPLSMAAQLTAAPVGASASFSGSVLSVVGFSAPLEAVTVKLPGFSSGYVLVSAGWVIAQVNLSTSHFKLEPLNPYTTAQLDLDFSNLFPSGGLDLSQAVVTVGNQSFKPV